MLRVAQDWDHLCRKMQARAEHDPPPQSCDTHDGVEEHRADDDADVIEYRRQGIDDELAEDLHDGRRDRRKAEKDRLKQHDARDRDGIFQDFRREAGEERGREMRQCEPQRYRRQDGEEAEGEKHVPEKDPLVFLFARREHRHEGVRGNEERQEREHRVRDLERREVRIQDRACPEDMRKGMVAEKREDLRKDRESRKQVRRLMQASDRPGEAG